MGSYSEPESQHGKKIPDVVLDTVMNWLKKEKEEGSFVDYLEKISLGGPLLSPENVLTENLIASLKETGQGKKKGFVKRQLTDLKPVCLELGRMALNTNQMILEKSRERYLELSLLAERINLHFVSCQASLDMERIKENEAVFPYPVERIDRELHEYLSREIIACWEDSNYFNKWVKEHFENEGNRTLPYSGNPEPVRKRFAKIMDNDSPDKMESISSFFKNDKDLHSFLESRDFSYGLTDVSDALFTKLMDEIKEELRLYTQEGEIEEGKALLLSENTIPFLRTVPVIDGEWIDHQMALYLEASGILSEDNFVFSSSEGIHPFALPLVISERTGNSIENITEDLKSNQAIFQKALAQAKEDLERYPWKSCIIRGREHIPLEKYLALERRHWKGTFKHKEGFKINSWNRWVIDEENENPEGIASIGNIRVHTIDIEEILGQVYESSREEIDRQNRIRYCNMDLVNKWEMHKKQSYSTDSDQNAGEGHYSAAYITDTEPVRKRLSEIRSMAENMTLDLLGMRTAVNWLSQEFFSDNNFLFPEIENDIDQTIASLHQLIETYNQQIASEIEEYSFSDPLCGEDNTGNNWEALFPKGYYISLETIREGVLERAKRIFSELSFLLR